MGKDVLSQRSFLNSAVASQQKRLTGVSTGTTHCRLGEIGSVLSESTQRRIFVQAHPFQNIFRQIGQLTAGEVKWKFFTHDAQGLMYTRFFRIEIISPSGYHSMTDFQLPAVLLKTVSGIPRLTDPFARLRKIVGP